MKADLCYVPARSNTNAGLTGPTSPGGPWNVQGCTLPVRMVDRRGQLAGRHPRAVGGGLRTGGLSAAAPFRRPCAGPDETTAHDSSAPTGSDGSGAAAAFGP